MSQVFFSLGTNLGQRRAMLRRAIMGIGAKLHVTAVSPSYETEPWGVTNQPDYLNCCVAAETDLTPEELLVFIKNLEVELGRLPGLRWGPRIIDIDIVYYDDLVLRQERLKIPHPHMTERAFVLVPLADIAPDFIDPFSGLTVLEMLAGVDATTARRVPEPLFAPEPV